MPLDIVVLNDHAYLEGGASRVALAQAQGLAERGHRVTFFAAQGAAHERGEQGWTERAPLPTYLTGQWDIANDPDRLGAAVRSTWNFRSARALQEVLQQLPSNNAVLLAHNWGKALSSSVIRAAHRSGVPILCTAHDYSIVCPNGALYSYPDNEHCALRPLSVRCVTRQCDKQSYAHKLYRVARQAVQSTVADVPSVVSGVIFPSEGTRKATAAWLPPGIDCHVLANPVATPTVDVTADVRAAKHLSFVGRLSPEKGAPLAAEAALLAGAEITFVGDGPDRAAVAARLPHARITGWLSAADVWRELATSRALIFSSLSRETFGLTVYEAASLGIPSIVPAGSVAEEFVRDGENGLVFAKGDAASLAAQMRRIWEQPDWAAQLGQRAQEDFRRRDYSMSRYMDGLEQIILATREKHAAQSRSQ